MAALKKPDFREEMKGYATLIKQTKEMLKTHGSLDASDETAALVVLLQRQMQLGEGVLQKLSAISGELTTLRHAINGLAKK